MGESAQIPQTIRRRKQLTIATFSAVQLVSPLIGMTTFGLESGFLTTLIFNCSFRAAYMFLAAAVKLKIFGFVIQPDRHEKVSILAMC